MNSSSARNITNGDEIMVVVVVAMDNNNNNQLFLHLGCDGASRYSYVDHSREQPTVTAYTAYIPPTPILTSELPSTTPPPP
jgi:hypothetical protein